MSNKLAMEHKKLKEIRQAKNITQNQMAKKIAMEQTTYSRKERGKSPILDDEWQRFAKALDVPVEEIKVENAPLTMKNDNCTFSENAIGIQYVNIPQNVFDIIIKYNTKLENDDQLKNLEIERLREEIEVLKGK